MCGDCKRFKITDCCCNIIPDSAMCGDHKEFWNSLKIIIDLLVGVIEFEVKLLVIELN